MSLPLILIFSSRADIEKHELLYNILMNKTLCRVFIAYADPYITRDFITENKYIVVKTQDDYDNSSNKLKRVLQFVHKNLCDYIGVIKINASMYLNIGALNDFLSMNMETIHYTGSIVTRDKNEFIQVSNPKSYLYHESDVYCPACVYCKGGIYYLSMETIKLIIKNFKTSFFEDVSVGVNCNNTDGNKIFPVETILNYSDNICDFIGSHILNNNCYYLFSRLHGDIGSQMFQIASTYGLARTYNMLPVFVYVNKEYYENKMLINDGIYKNLPFVFIDYLKTYKEVLKIHNYDGEMRGTNYMIKHPVITKSTNYYIEGYFQNEKYFYDIKDWVINCFYDETKIKQFQMNYKCLKESYFIHIQTKYLEDHKTYILKCINQAPSDNYYIISDNNRLVQKSGLFLETQNIVYLQEEIGDLDKIYFMASCGKGGICTNNAISWWGGYLGKHERKIYFPKKWVNSMIKCDIFFNGSYVVDHKK